MLENNPVGDSTDNIRYWFLFKVMEHKTLNINSFLCLLPNKTSMFTDYHYIIKRSKLSLSKLI